MAKRKSDSDALLPSDIQESSPKAKVQCVASDPAMASAWSPTCSALSFFVLIIVDMSSLYVSFPAK